MQCVNVSKIVKFASIFLTASLMSDKKPPWSRRSLVQALRIF